MTPKHNNNFDLLRLIAALFVWFGHCYALSGAPDPLNARIAFMAFGQIGVAAFFVISGYFVTASYVHHNAIAIYLRNRVLRIFPALIIVVLLSVFLLGPTVTNLPLRDYFTQPQTWIYLKSMLIFPLHYNLPGAFVDLPLHAVNGSLWTLKQEVRCYIIIAILGICGVLKPRTMLIVLVTLYGIRLYGTLTEPVRLLGMKWGDLNLAVSLGSLFASGAMLYLARAIVPLKIQWAVCAGILVAASLWLSPTLGNILFDASFAYIVIYAGFLNLPWRGLKLRNDFSYGIYIYSFPMQQLTLTLIGIHHFAWFLMLSLVLTIGCAAASWFLIERPALQLKS